MEISENLPSLDEVKAFESLRLQIAARIKEVLDVEAKVILLEPGSLRQFTGGSERVLDRRPG